MKELIYISTSRLHRERANLIQTLYTVNALVRAYPRVCLIMPPPRLKIPVKERLREIGVKEDLPLCFSRLLHSRWKALGYHPFFFLNRRRLKKALVFVRSFRLSKALCSLGIPHLFEAHDIEQLKENQCIRWMKTHCQDLTIRRIITISKALKEELQKEGLDPSRIVVVPSGVDLDRFNAIQPLEKERLLDPTLIHVGTLNKSRGLKVINALIKRGYPTILAGRIEGMVENSVNVRIEGYVPHLSVTTLYEEADIAIVPYQEDLDTVASFSSIKLIEAMAAGRIIVASDLRPIREVVTNKKEALLVGPDKIGDWIAAVERLKNDQGLALRLAGAARLKAQEFGWDVRALKILSLFGVEAKKR